MIQEILVLLVRVAVDIYTLMVLLRLILQLVRADFYNPISQFIVKATNPLLLPLRKIIPGFGGIDIAAIFLAFLVQMAGVALLFLIVGVGVVNPLAYVIYAAVGLLDVLLNFYFFAILILVVLSWVAPNSHSPGTQLIYQITEPLMRPIRQMIPLNKTIKASKLETRL